MEKEKQTVETAENKPKVAAKSNNKIAAKPKPNQMHKVEIKNQKELIITGVTRVDASSPTSCSLQVGDTTLMVMGEGMNVKRLDVTEGVLEVGGKILGLKYSGGKKYQESILKRIFK